MQIQIHWFEYSVRWLIIPEPELEPEMEELEPDSGSLGMKVVRREGTNCGVRVWGKGKWLGERTKHDLLVRCERMRHPDHTPEHTYFSAEALVPCVNCAWCVVLCCAWGSWNIGEASSKKLHA